VSRRGWALFAAMCLIWGIPYLLIRVAVRDLSPASVVFFRTAAATLLLLPIAVRRGALVDVFRRWRPLLLFTAIEVTAPWWLLSTAEQHLSSALTGLLIAAVPLFGVLLSRLVGTAEVFDRVRLFGLALGVAGVGSLVGLQIGHVNGLAVLAVLVTALGYAAGPLVLSRRLADLPAVGVTTASLAITTVVWAAPAALSMPEHVSGDVVWSMVGLAVVCTAAAFVIFFALIAEVGPTRATVITYVNPAVAILLGVAVLGEHFTLGMAIGFPLVIAGSVLATLQRKDAATDDGDVAELPLVVAEASVSGWASSHRDRQV
jgi:drug/metabolite transporter (DMT)-like permease